MSTINDSLDDLVITLQSIDIAHRNTAPKVKKVKRSSKKDVVESIKEHVKFTQETNTPFMHMAKLGIYIGIGDLMCVVGDIIWLFGDMSIHIQPHHYLVASILIPAMLLIGVSFVYLGKAMLQYERRHREQLHKSQEHKIHEEIKEFYQHNRES